MLGTRVVLSNEIRWFKTPPNKLSIPIDLVKEFFSSIRKHQVGDTSGRITVNVNVILFVFHFFVLFYASFFPSRIFFFPSFHRLSFPVPVLV